MSLADKYYEAAARLESEGYDTGAFGGVKAAVCPHCGVPLGAGVATKDQPPPPNPFPRAGGGFGSWGGYGNANRPTPVPRNRAPWSINPHPAASGGYWHPFGGAGKAGPPGMTGSERTAGQRYPTATPNRPSHPLAPPSYAGRPVPAHPRSERPLRWGNLYARNSEIQELLHADGSR